MSSKPNKHPSMSFDQHVQIAVHNAIKGDIDAKVTEATMIVAQEARKALSSMKMRLDALENLLLAKKEVTSTSLQEALWNVQETLFGIAPTDAPAELGCGVRLRVKEEKIGEETDAEPATESYVVLGQGEITPDVQNALLGAKAGEIKTFEADDQNATGDVKPRYKITLKVDRVYAKKEVATPAPSQV